MNKSRLPILPIRYRQSSTQTQGLTYSLTTVKLEEVTKKEPEQVQKSEEVTKKEPEQVQKSELQDFQDDEILFLELLASLIDDAKKQNEVQSGLSVPNGVIDEHWLYLKNFLTFSPHYPITFQSLDLELKPFLGIGTVKVYNQLYQERRQTAYFSLDNAVMRYSGRVLQPNAVIDGTIIARIFDLVNSIGFQMLMVSQYGIEMPRFNAVFINKYRSAQELKAASVDKIDMLGWHADDEREHTADTILSFTICETGGERVFELRPKKATSGVSRQVQLDSHSCFIMLPGCQSHWKHRISDRVVRLTGGYITGARYNLTFRSLAQ
jgi:alkylated DNA repair dioxygenase AlkB